MSIHVGISDVRGILSVLPPFDEESSDQIGAQPREVPPHPHGSAANLAPLRMRSSASSSVSSSLTRVSGFPSGSKKRPSKLKRPARTEYRAVRGADVVATMAVISAIVGTRRARMPR